MVVAQPGGGKLDPLLARPHRRLAHQVEAQGLVIEALGALLVGYRHGDDFERDDRHALFLPLGSVAR